MKHSPLSLSVILPVHDQEDQIKANFVRIFEYLSKFNAEIIVIESGSKDNSVRLIKGLKKRYDFRFIQPSGLGRGLVLKEGIKIAKGDIIGYFDTDLAVPLKYLDITLSKFDQGYDVVSGNRYLKRSKARRKLSRYIESKVYIYLVRLLYLSKITDFQCGFKFFKSDFIKKAISKVDDNRWFWDTNILLLAEKTNRKICQLPVEFADTDKTTVKHSDIVYFIKQVAVNRATSSLVSENEEVEEEEMVSAQRRKVQSTR